MQGVVRPPIARVMDPANVWTGRTGDIIGPGPNGGIWWRDHLTGTQVLLHPHQLRSAP